LVFHENKGGATIAVIEDLSGNGTFVNEVRLGRNKRVMLHDDDEISILGEARCVFRYPRNTSHKGFKQQFIVHQQLGKGHFATVYLATEKCSGMKYAVKKFDKRVGPGERSRVEGLHQEIAVLMGVSHPNMLCLKESFEEDDGVYLVLELAAEGELFNWIVTHNKLTEDETRKVFIQLFQGVKYLVRFEVFILHMYTNLRIPTQHERSIVHRDIKPENILLVDKDLHLKLADFGLAKIIGEESFTTTLCGTPSCTHISPFLESSNPSLFSPLTLARSQTWRPKSSSRQTTGATRAPSTSGRSAWCSTSACVASHPSATSSTRTRTRTHWRSRSKWAASTTPRPTGTPSRTSPSTSSTAC